MRTSPRHRDRALMHANHVGNVRAAHYLLFSMGVQAGFGVADGGCGLQICKALTHGEWLRAEAKEPVALVLVRMLCDL